jgi:glycosyltransferase involved in cell wall biosynthesis
MKVAFIAHQYPPQFHSGGAIYAYKLSHALEDLGVDITRISQSSMDDKGVKIHARNLLSFVLKARNHVKDVDLVHGNMLGDIVIFNKPCVTTLHHPMKYDRPPASLRWKISEAGERLCFMKAKAVLTDSKFSFVEFKKLYGNGKIHIIKLGVDQVRDAKLGDPHKILCTTGLGSRKGIELILQTAGALADGPQQFYLIGNGYEKPRFESLAAKMKLKNVHFLGVVSDEEIERLYSTCGLCIVSSLYEGFSLPLLDGMAHKKVAITTKVGIAPEIIENGKNGFMVERRDPQLIASIIRKLADDKKLLSRVAQKGYETSKSFTWRNAAKETLRVYEEVLGAS